MPALSVAECSVKVMLSKFQDDKHLAHSSMKLHVFFTQLCILFVALVLGVEGTAWSACGGTVRTWTAGNGNQNWNANANWSGNNQPDTATEDVVVVAAAFNTRANLTTTIGCLEVQSGQLNTPNPAVTLTIAGDYFRNLNTGNVNITAGRPWTLIMGGTAPQTLENVDPLNFVTISNPSTVTFTEAFTIRDALAFTGTGTTLYINNNLTLVDTATPLAIPATVTVEVGNGATLVAPGGITVNGTLKIKAGGKVQIGNGRTLQVAAGGLLQLAGASGNIADLDSVGVGNTYTLNVVGSVNLSYFKISRTVAAGMNVTGTIQAMSNGEFHFPASAGYAVTLGAAASVPATITSVGFFDDSGFANTRNFNATTFNVSAVTLNNWSGAAGGAAKENDPNGRINWGAQAGTELTLTNSTASGSPPATIAQSSADVLFATFGFALTQADLATDITNVTLTMSGTASASDINLVKIYRDAGAGVNCVYNAGVDTQVGGNLTLSGSPPSATFALAAADVRTNSTTRACFHVLASTSATAQNAKSIQFKLNATADVTNSFGYVFSAASGPPVSAGTSTIAGDAVREWQGDVSTLWNAGNNWTGNAAPTAAVDCDIGPGTRVCNVNIAAAVCQNVRLLTGGTLDFASTTNELAARGTMLVQPTYTFTNATTANLAMRGAVSQTLAIGTAFPGNLIIANTGGAGNNIVSVSDNSTVNGNLTVTSGILRINDGYELTVLGNITVQTGAALEIDPGGTLNLGNGRTLTVNTGGRLKIVGSAVKSSRITSNTGTAAYAVTVNGTIEAQYYTLDHLNTTGLTINSGATISATYHLQNGNFTYPVNNGTTMLRLYRQVPTNTMNNVTFDAAGSAATSSVNIYTDAAVAAGTLTITGYTGSFAGPTSDNDNSYLLVWSGASNTINLTSEASGPANVNAGQTYNMGRFGFKQTLAGASYNDADITSLRLAMTGTGSASDVGQARIYYDSDCDGASGTLLGSGTFSGNPGTLNFTGLTGATIHASATTPPLRCVYVEYDIALGATTGNTVGVKINAAGDVVNDESYAISASTPTPVDLGTAATIAGSTITTWTGTTNTNWFTATNWSAGVPTAAKTCQIPNAVNDPVINGGTAICNHVDITNGIVTMVNASAAVWEVYGNFSNTGTFTQNDGTLRFRDNGVTPTTQTVTSNSTLGTVTFNKTAGGAGQLRPGGSALTITTLTIPGGSNFELLVPNGHTLTLLNNLTLPAATINIRDGATLAMANTRTITVSGGTFRISGVNDAYPQSTANKGKVTVSGAGRWGFTTTSGTVNLVGFLFDYLDTNGLNIGGTTIVSNLSGGQFTNLSTTYASVRALQLNTSGAVPATALNVGWNWGAANSLYNNPPSPLVADAYVLARSTGCGNQTITFDQWFGDFFVGVNQPVPSTKVSSTNCNIIIAASASAVSMLSLAATPYNGKVSIDWETSTETNHAGFNVYRSTNPSTGFIQVNRALIRNFKQSTLARGLYRYLDSEVTNDATYFYRVEDVALNGTKTMHGPVSATPVATLGAAPADGGTTNSGSSSSGASTGNGPSSGIIGTPDVIDLGNGVHVLAKTKKSLRLEIVPPAVAYSASAWNAAYQTVVIPGYSSLTEANKPELLERTILVEVDSSYANATVTQASVQEGVVTNHQIAPAPSWAPDGSNILQPSYSLDAPAYASASYSPNVFYNVTPTLSTVSGKKYVQIKVTPLLYKASTQEVRRATKIVLDIGLDGAAWVASAPTGAAALSPSAVEGALRIRYSRGGMHELTFADIEAAGLEGFFEGVGPTLFRMTYRGTEVPIEVIAATASFSTGDSIRFYAPYIRELEDVENEMVLSLFALNGVIDPPLRMQHADADPSAVPSTTEVGTWAMMSAEENNTPIFDVPLGDNVERFYWGRVFAQNGVASGATSYLDIPLALENLIPGGVRPVHLKVYLRGRGSLAVNPTHHLGVYVNTVPFMIDDNTFTTNDPTILDFDLPSAFFANGANSIRLQVIADQVAAGDFDILDIDRIEVSYKASRVAINDSLEVYNGVMGRSYAVSGFSANTISSYDVTDPLNSLLLDNVAITTPDGGASYTAELAPPVGASGEQGYRMISLTEGAYLKPSSLLLGKGYDTALKSALVGADLIVVGADELLDAAQDLIAARRAEGLRVVAVPLDQVYAEFSHGIKSSQAIRELVLYARATWVAPAPRYLLLLGDATYDPRDHYAYARSASVMPIPIEKGLYMDFGNDNWFVAATDGTDIPMMSVGRIPTSNAAAVSQYVEKLLAYESGSRSPTGAQAKALAFISDSDTMGEGFLAQATALASSAISARSAFSTTSIDRTAIGNDALTKNQIISSFNNGALTMTYLGHGAEDRWAAASVFTNSDAAALTNSRLPVVVALNCLNSNFYDPDPTFESLGEKLVLNPDGGAIAFWGSTTMTIPTVQAALSTSFTNALGQETGTPYHVVRIGDLVMQAKVAVGSTAATRDAVRSYSLFGDPSMKMPANAFAPATASSGGGAAAGGIAKDEGKKSVLAGCASIRNSDDDDGPGTGGLAEMSMMVLFLIAARALLLSGARVRSRI